MDNQRKGKRFSRLSPFYDSLVFLFYGRSLDKAGKYFFPELKSCKRILIFGGGTGKSLAELLKQTNADEYYFIDFSEKMIERAKERTTDKRVRFICGTYMDVPPVRFDAVITPFVLDCLNENELPVALNHLHSSLVKGGTWLFTDFNIPPKGVMHLIARATVRLMYFFFNITTGLGIKRLPPFSEEFRRCGLKLIKERYSLSGLLTTKIYLNESGNS